MLLFCSSSFLFLRSKAMDGGRGGGGGGDVLACKAELICP